MEYSEYSDKTWMRLVDLVKKFQLGKSLVLECWALQLPKPETAAMPWISASNIDGCFKVIRDLKHQYHAVPLPSLNVKNQTWEVFSVQRELDETQRPRSWRGLVSKATWLWFPRASLFQHKLKRAPSQWDNHMCLCQLNNIWKSRSHMIKCYTEVQHEVGCTIEQNMIFQVWPIVCLVFCMSEQLLTSCLPPFGLVKSTMWDAEKQQLRRLCTAQELSCSACNKIVSGCFCKELQAS